MFIHGRQIKDGIKVTFKIQDKQVVKIPYGNRHKIFTIKPLWVYYADLEFLEACNVPYVRVGSDKTRIGTTLKAWFHHLGIRSQGGCGCDATARYLDLTDVKTLRKNRKTVVNQLILKHEMRSKRKRTNWRRIRREIVAGLSDSMPKWLARIVIAIVYRVAIYYEKSKI
tara:strand:+ start:17733 stop:18239 length:507 start_codon:yes stop_codon:yes gene_type:complete